VPTNPDNPKEIKGFGLVFGGLTIILTSEIGDILV